MAKNDPPTSFRRGYGFSQARSAGAPYVPPRPAWKVNWDIRAKRAEKNLRELLKQHPSIKPLVLKIIEAQKGQARAMWTYHCVLLNRPDLAPSDYWDSTAWLGWPRPPQSN
jgi:hypothetical protein